MGFLLFFTIYWRTFLQNTFLIYQQTNIFRICSFRLIWLSFLKFEEFWRNWHRFSELLGRGIFGSTFFLLNRLSFTFQKANSYPIFWNQRLRILVTFIILWICVMGLVCGDYCLVDVVADILEFFSIGGPVYELYCKHFWLLLTPCDQLVYRNCNVLQKLGQLFVVPPSLRRQI